MLILFVLLSVLVLVLLSLLLFLVLVLTPLLLLVTGFALALCTFWLGFRFCCTFNWSNVKRKSR